MEQVDSLKTREKFKKTEIGEIPVDWEVMQIHDLCTLGRGRVISQNEIDNNPGQYPVFSSQSKDKGVMGYINSYDFDGEYVTWTTDGAYAGTVFYRGAKFNCTNVCGTLKSRVEFINMSYLCYALNRLTKRHVVLCGNPKLMNNVMAQIKVQIPPLPEQKKIAEILTSVDSAIGKSDQVIEKTKELKKGLMQRLLTRGIGHTKFKKTKIGEIPVDWKLTNIEEVCEIVGGSTPSTKEPKFWNGSIFWAIPTDITSLRSNIISQTEKTITTEGLSNCAARILPNGSILLTSRATIGECAINDTPMATNQGFANLICKDTVYNWYILYRLKYVKKELEKLACGSTFKEVSKRSLRAMPLPLPPLAEQKKIAEILTTVDEQIEKENANKEKLESMKKGLMQVLLTGKVRVRI